MYDRQSRHVLPVLFTGVLFLHSHLEHVSAWDWIPVRLRMGYTWVRWACLANLERVGDRIAKRAGKRGETWYACVGGDGKVDVTMFCVFVNRE